MSTATWSTIDTKIGPFTAVVDADGAVLASGWTAELDELLPQIHPSLRPTELVPDDIGPVGVDDGGERADPRVDRGPGGGAHDVLRFEVVAGAARQRWVAA